MTLSDVADAGRIPVGMRPYFLETARAISHYCDGDEGTLKSVLPILIMLIRYFEIYAPAEEMAILLVEFFHASMSYTKTPFGLIPEFRCEGDIHHNDKHATFLVETWHAFVDGHTAILKVRIENPEL